MIGTAVDAPGEAPSNPAIVPSAGSGNPTDRGSVMDKEVVFAVQEPDWAVAQRQLAEKNASTKIFFIAMIVW